MNVIFIPLLVIITVVFINSLFQSKPNKSLLLKHLFPLDLSNIKHLSLTSAGKSILIFIYSRDLLNKNINPHNGFYKI